MDAIAIIHHRNKERLDKFSNTFKLKGVEGWRTVSMDVIVYSFKGLLEICRYSNQQKANAVMDWLLDVADDIRRTGRYSAAHAPAIPSNAINEASALYELAGLKGNQLTLALDKLYKSYTGRSALQAASIELEAPAKRQLLTPTDIGKQYGISGSKVNSILANAGFQHKVAGKWEPLPKGASFAVMQDTGKKHSDGTPVRQLKWKSDILEAFDYLFYGTEDD